MAADGDAIVRIHDSGEGIAPEFLPHVFDRFRQENAAVTRTHSGLGLGLSLVRHLVELHGGRIEGESDGKGQGSTFTVRLPLLGAAEGRSGAAAAPPPMPDVNMIRGRRILIVDDDADTRELAAEALAQAGVRTVTAASVAEAFEIIAADPPDAIVADIGMPVVSGYDLVRRLQKDCGRRESDGRPDGVWRGARRGAGVPSAYVRKP